MIFDLKTERIKLKIAHFRILRLKQNLLFKYFCEKNYKGMSKKFLFVVEVLLAVFLLAQFYQPEIYKVVPSSKEEVRFTSEVDAIFRRACYDCHSNETSLKWYNKITPINLLVAEDIKMARQGLNFSTFDSLSEAAQKNKLWQAVNRVIVGSMPIERYTAIHPEAKLSAEDVKVLEDYVTSLAPKMTVSETKEKDLLEQYKIWSSQAIMPVIESIPVDINGSPFIPEYKNWMPISNTQRIDNGTIRIIYGNDIAVKAIKDRQTNPWPNGTIIAKVGWEQLVDDEGNVTTGAFKQVEYMTKDDVKFKETVGWGWSRFRTSKFVPFGETASFTMDCVSCHRPVKNNDYVFTLPIAF